MDKTKLQEFIVKARTKTYAASGGKVEPAFPGSYQLEHSEGEWFYRDIYYNGNGIFNGLEAVYFQSKPVWAMSYAGDFRKMSEQEIDSILRQALIANWQKARLWYKVEWARDNYKYTCTPDSKGSIDLMAGREKVLRESKEVYSFDYAGGYIGSPR